MTLKFPDTNVDFSATPAYFIGDFDIYDREDSLGEYLNRYDPNEKEQLHRLLRERFFEGARVGKLTNLHKADLMKVLIQALNDDAFNFDSILTHEREPGDYFTLPWDWEFERPRFFFEEVYRLASELWSQELREIDMVLPSLAEVNVPEN